MILLSSASYVTVWTFSWIFLGLAWNLIDFSQNDLHTCFSSRYSIIIYIHLVFIFNFYILFVKYNNYRIYNVGFQVFYSSIPLAIFGIFYNRSYDLSHFKIRGFKIVLWCNLCWKLIQLYWRCLQLSSLQIPTPINVQDITTISNRVSQMIQNCFGFALLRTSLSTDHKEK